MITTPDDMTKVYVAQQVHAAVTWAPLAHALEREYVDGAEVPSSLECADYSSIVQPRESNFFR